MSSKLTSRKFWVSILTAIGGILVAILDLDPGIVDNIVGYSISLVMAVVYVITEGRVDAAAVGQAAVDVECIIEAVKEIIQDEKVGGSE